METKVVMMMLLCCNALVLWGVSCPGCGNAMLDNDNFCQNCGRSREEKPVKKQAPPPMRQPVSQPVYRPVVRQAQPSYHPSRPNGYSNRSGGEFSFGDRLGGIGRGLSTAVISPLNLFRGMTVGVCWTASMVEGANIQDGQAVMYLSLLTIPVGTAFSSFAICADAINGVVDFGTAGYYGDWLYDSTESGKPTPWIWERKWKTCDVPWIERK